MSPETRPVISEPVQPASPSEVFAAGVKQRLAALPPGTQFTDFSAFVDLVEDPRLQEILAQMSPLQRKTRAMMRIEEELDGRPPELDIFEKYWLRHMSMSQVAEGYGVVNSYVLRIMRAANISIRSRSQANQLLWDNRKEEMIAKIHNDESDQLRSRSLICWYEEHPEELRQKVQATQETSARNREQKLLNALGLYPELTLYRLHYQEGYSVAEISARTGLPERTIRGLMKKYGIKDLDVKGHGTVEAMQTVHEVLPEIYTNPDRMEVLTLAEQQVIYMRFIEPEYNITTLEAVGYEIGVTKERVRQIQEDAVEALQSYSSYHQRRMEVDMWRKRPSKVFQHDDD